jgi:hypothetical protein
MGTDEEEVCLSTSSVAKILFFERLGKGGGFV